MAIWAALPRWAKGLLVMLALAAAAYGLGAKDALQDVAQKATQNYKEGRKDADDALGDLPADDDGLREWLRRFGD